MKCVTEKAGRGLGKWAAWDGHNQSVNPAWRGGLALEKARPERRPMGPACSSQSLHYLPHQQVCLMSVPISQGCL